MGKVRNASIGTGGFTGKTFGISGIENDKAGATTHKAVKSGRSAKMRDRIGGGGAKRAKMAHHKSAL